MLKRKGKTKTKVGIKDPNQLEKAAEKKPVGKPPKRIRMLISLASQHGSWTAGKEYDVPQDVPVNSARSWVASGAAEDISPEEP